MLFPIIERFPLGRKNDRMLPSMVKVPFTDAPLSFLGFIVVAPFLVVVLVIYLHVFYGYWLECERERQYLNQRLIPPIESIPTLFSFPDVVPRLLTRFVFYWLVPLVLVTITWKAWALPEMGLPLTHVTGLVTFILVLLRIRRRPHHQWQWWSLLDYAILVLVIGLMVRATFNPQSFQRPLNLFRAELSKAWLVEINMRRASAYGANLQGATLWEAKLQDADLTLANLEGASLQMADLKRARLQRANLQNANLFGARFNEANLDEANLQGARGGIGAEKASLQRANLQGLYLYGSLLNYADLRWANLQEANLQAAHLVKANLRQTKLQGANLQGANLTKAKNLTQEQVNTACINEHTQLPEGLTRPAPCPVKP